MLIKKRYFFLIMSVIVLYSCGKNDSTTAYTSTCTYTPSTLVAPAAEVTYLQTYLSSRSITATKDTSGIFYKIDSVGSGTVVPVVCSLIQIDYTGNLLTTDNTNPQFDTNTGVVFTLGDLIVGWQKGIPLIRKGGSITLYIPPSLAYGNKVVGTIPANSYLKFTIHLLAIQ